MRPLVRTCLLALAPLLASCGSPEDGGPDAGGRAFDRPFEITSDAIERGRQLYRVQGCLTCHSIDASPGTAPSFAGLYMRERNLQNGQTVIADVPYLRRSIVASDAQLVEGYPAGQMVDYDARLTDADVDALVAYIASLEDANTTAEQAPAPRADLRPDGRPSWWFSDPVRRGDDVLACGESIADTVIDARSGAIDDALDAIRLWAGLDMDAPLTSAQPELAAVLPLPNPGGPQRYVGYVQLKVPAPEGAPDP